MLCELDKPMWSMPCTICIRYLTSVKQYPISHVFKTIEWNLISGSSLYHKWKHSYNRIMIKKIYFSEILHWFKKYFWCPYNVSPNLLLFTSQTILAHLLTHGSWMDIWKIKLMYSTLHHKQKLLPLMNHHQWVSLLLWAVICLWASMSSGQM